MKNLKLYPYRMGSESAKALAGLLQVKRVRGDGLYAPLPSTTIVNWGNGRAPNWRRNPRQMLNKPTAVNIASNKLLSFQAFKNAGIRTPEFTTDISVARRWLTSGTTVVERHVLRGNSGEGIRIVNLDDTEVDSIITSALLYTKFIKKTAEFRVHVFKGEVIDYIQKLKTTSANRPANFNPYVSSINMGWVFSRTEALDLPVVKQIALRAVAALGLDFGAVDVMYLDGQAYVLEVNTSPGLAGTTLVKYGNALRRHMGLSALPDTVTRTILDPVITAQTTVQSVHRPVAARVAQVNRPIPEEMVTVQLTRSELMKLRTLLARV